ncbi:MAG: tRNA pseudouridine synthase 10 [Candidatus Argoarchaeum ethanivorans]|uniref:tRNA pseudouridine synthase Pus10 n=1 Tax=Candidatus Argoarchaeum ethanivorans TaxID=2608793 RepID=A0A8B3S139_9EURY|nr:MAG: tRNA pseudouridine synthase 10 [Candidatus Argoarchaeum ethanivorans]
MLLPKYLMDNNILQMASSILSEGSICDHCMGRMFANLSTDLSNDIRGAAIKLVLSMECDRMRKESGSTEWLEKLSKSSRYARKVLGKGGDEDVCWVCGNLFNNIELWVERVIDALSAVEYNSFLISTKMTGLLSENEEILWSESGTRFAEPIKTELNREVGKIVEKRTGKKAQLGRPDVVVVIELENDRVGLDINSLFIYGRYRKLVRGIPQTRWACRFCGGKGCEECGFTGKLYPESVEELISETVIKAFNATGTVFHGAGREDVDALMLGNGRPFALEVRGAKKRSSIDLSALQQETNTFTSYKVEVSNLEYVDHSKVKQIKEVRTDKAYRLTVMLGGDVPEERLKLCSNKLRGVITQQTPTRALHHRADRLRKRSVRSIELESFDENVAVFIVTCESGLYVKELISGDGGRTTPSLGGELGICAKVISIDVINIES